MDLRQLYMFEINLNNYGLKFDLPISSIVFRGYVPKLKPILSNIEFTGP